MKQIQFFLCVINFIKLSSSSPIVTDFDPASAHNNFIPSNFCLLPPELGFNGNVAFIEDCPSLQRYKTIPLPGDFFRKLGTHPVVCCPEYLPESAICFESDAWCPNYKPPQPVDYDYTDAQSEQLQAIEEDYDYIPVVTDPIITIQELPKMSDNECKDNGQYTTINGTLELSQCVPLNQCGKILDNEYAPRTQVKPCGFDEDNSVMMICCPEDFVTATPVKTEQKPRFPQRGKARRVDDIAGRKECRKWKENEGCALDKDLVISELDEDNGRVISKVLFDFMQGACLSTCGWTGRKGCIDEHPNCPLWARRGMCIVAPLFMTHTCRESCGVCGFLSPGNKEEQVVGGLSYTDFTRENFDCGRYKPLCEINNETCEKKQEVTTEVTLTVTPETDLFDLRQADADVFFSIEPGKNPEDYFCGATVVSDRWVVAAAHCYDEFEASATNKPRSIKINTIRDSTENIEIIEIKKVYKHPKYKYPNLYDDVAVLELGRRIEYNYEVYGDTPSCIDQGQDNIGRVATVQGYGFTETGERGSLLETNVTIITNEKCKEYLNYNATDNQIVRNQIDKALPHGLNYGLLCAQGTMNDAGVFRGSCKGDSGGPLTADNDKGRRTLVGIVSGGIGCGQGFPGWYTNVSFHTRWIKCIIERSAQYNNNYSKVSEACKNSVSNAPKCSTNDDLIFGDLRSVDPDVEICSTDYDYDIRGADD